MGVTCQIYRDPREFSRIATPFLAEKEAAHCLGLGVIHSLVNSPAQHVDVHLAAFREDAGEALLGLAWMTTPQPLGASEMPDACVPALLDFARQLPYRPSGIAAPGRIAESFKDHWLSRGDCHIHKAYRQCIYELKTLIPPRPIRGRVRLATSRDAALLSAWCWSFVVDCGMAKGKDAGHGKTYARQAIQDKSRYLLEVDGRVVAMVGVQGHTPSGIRISWVYTPARERGNGYASYLVAEVCKEQFAKGKKRCFLYTDLDNPTSNHIYQSLGFEAVTEPAHYCFGYGSAS